MLVYLLRPNETTPKERCPSVKNSSMLTNRSLGYNSKTITSISIRISLSHGFEPICRFSISYQKEAIPCGVGLASNIFQLVRCLSTWTCSYVYWE